MDNLVFISCQPANNYFLWQIEVQITNFRQFGISDKMHVLLWHRKEDDLSTWKELEEKYPEVKFFYYEDSGAEIGVYLPILRPHTIKKHFQQHQERLSDKCFFYHDSDIIFNKLPDFETLMKDDIVWQSNCSGYLDYSYLRSKEKEGKIPEGRTIRKLAEIGGIKPEIIKYYDKKTGGCQVLLKNIDANFWKDVEEMSLKIILAFNSRFKGSFNQKYFKSESLGIQSWTSDMWSLNLALWKKGIKTNITPELDFSWATDNIETFHKKNIFHCAGVAESGVGTFYKGEWIKQSPIGKNLQVSEDSACLEYVKLINSI